MSGKKRPVVIRGENRSDPSFVDMSEARNQKRDYGAIIRKYRIANNVMQHQIALDLGFSKNYISFLETGKSRPTIDVVVPLCKYLHIPLDEFLGVGSDDYVLNETERRMLNAFNALPKDARDDLISFMEHLLEKQENQSK